MKYKGSQTRLLRQAPQWETRQDGEELTSGWKLLDEIYYMDDICGWNIAESQISLETGVTCELLRRDKKTKKKRKTTTCDGEEDDEEAHVVVVSFRLDFELSWRFWLCRWQQLVLYDPFLQQRSNPVPHYRCVLVFGTGLLQIMWMNGFKSLSVFFPSFLAASQNVKFGRELWLPFLPM